MIRQTKKQKTYNRNFHTTNYLCVDPKAPFSYSESFRKVLQDTVNVITLITLGKQYIDKPIEQKSLNLDKSHDIIDIKSLVEIKKIPKSFDQVQFEIDMCTYTQLVNERTELSKWFTDRNLSHMFTEYDISLPIMGIVYKGTKVYKNIGLPSTSEVGSESASSVCKRISESAKNSDCTPLKFDTDFSSTTISKFSENSLELEFIYLNPFPEFWLFFGVIILLLNILKKKNIYII